MEIEPFKTLSRYNLWANSRIYAVAGRLLETEFVQSRAMYAGSISGLLHHLLSTDSWSMAILTGDEKGFLPRDFHGNVIVVDSSSPCFYTKFSELELARIHLDRQIYEYLETLTEVELSERVAFFDRDGERRRETRRQLLTAQFMHQAYHRGQLTAVLYAMGKPVTNLEYDTFLRSQ
jgi:uncharacterized damage-inducible protein DinB